MSKIYIVTKRESGIYEEEAYYTFYRIESVPLFLSSHKVKINRPKHTTYPIGELVKLKISGEK